MCKKNYYIGIIGESYGYTTKSLTDDEYKLIKDIFDDCESEYISACIHELPDIDMLYEKHNIAQLKYPTLFEIQSILYSDKEIRENIDNFPLLCISTMLFDKYKQENKI